MSPEALADKKELQQSKPIAQNGKKQLLKVEAQKPSRPQQQVKAHVQPGIVKHSIAMPDVHAGYVFTIGNVAGFDMGNQLSVVSPAASASTSTAACA